MKIKEVLNRIAKRIDVVSEVNSVYYARGADVLDGWYWKNSTFGELFIGENSEEALDYLLCEYENIYKTIRNIQETKQRLANYSDMYDILDEFESRKTLAVSADLFAIIICLLFSIAILLL